MKTKLIMVFCMVFALLSGAFAVSVADVSLAQDDAVERSNPLLEGSDNELDRDEELEYALFSVPVTANNGAVKVTGLTLDSSFTYETLTDDNSNDDIFVVTSTLPMDIANGTTKNVAVKVLVPSNLDSIDSSFNAISHSVNVNVITNQTTESAKLSFYVENGLELSDVEIETLDESIECDVDEGQTSLDCDDEIEELSPTQNFVLNFVVENIFDSDSDLDLDDTEMELDSDNNDVEADDDSFDDDIDAEDEISYSIDFDVDSDVEDGDDAEITITAYGVDPNGAAHGFKYTFKVEFQVPDWDLMLSGVVVSPTAICQGETAIVSYDVENLGGKDQDTVRVQARSSSLNIDKVSDRIKLEDEDSRDNDYQGEFSIETKSSTKAGRYAIEVIAYYRDEDSNDAALFERVELVVQDCEGDDQDNSGTSTGTGTTQPPVVVVQPPVEPTVVEPTQTTEPVAATVTKKAAANAWMVAGLVIVILVILILIGVIIAILRK